MRVGIGGAATIQGTTPVPRPHSEANESNAQVVRRAKQIAVGLFIILVLAHATKD